MRCGAMQAGARPDLELARERRVSERAAFEDEQPRMFDPAKLWALPEELDIADVWGRAAVWVLLAFWMAWRSGCRPCCAP